LLTTWRQLQNTHDFDNKKKHIYGAGEGDLSTGAVMGGQVGPTASMMISRPWPFGAGPPGSRTCFCVWRSGKKHEGNKGGGRRASKDGNKDFAANCGRVGGRVPRTGHGIGCHVIDGRRMKQEEDHVHNSGYFRRNDTANEDEFGCGQQR
jgi:hypothetical protein